VDDDDDDEEEEKKDGEDGDEPKIEEVEEEEEKKEKKKKKVPAATQLRTHARAHTRHLICVPPILSAPRSSSSTLARVPL